MGEFVDLLTARLRQLKEERGWGQEEVAKRAGMTQQNLSLYIHGKQRVTPHAAGELIAAAEMDPEVAAHAYFRDLAAIHDHPFFHQFREWAGLQDDDPDKPDVT